MTKGKSISLAKDPSINIFKRELRSQMLRSLRDPGHPNDECQNQRL